MSWIEGPRWPQQATPTKKQIKILLIFFCCLACSGCALFVWLCCFMNQPISLLLVLFSWRSHWLASQPITHHSKREERDCFHHSQHQWNSSCSNQFTNQSHNLICWIELAALDCSLGPQRPQQTTNQSSIPFSKKWMKWFVGFADGQRRLISSIPFNNSFH